MGNWLVFPNRFRPNSYLTMTVGVALLAAASILLSDIPTMIASRGWPTASGVITSRRIVGQQFEEYDGDFYTRIEGYLSYRYQVGGEEYSARSVNALESSSCPEVTAQNYPVGRQVSVSYSPRDPSRAVLDLGGCFHPRHSAWQQR